MARGIQIVSDFKDYYDNLSNDVDPLLIYTEIILIVCLGRKSKWVRDNGIKTIKLGLARQFISSHKKVVVYTNLSCTNSKVINSRYTTAVDLYLLI